jgi:iron complex transport system ATP-binding protein
MCLIEMEGVTIVRDSVRVLDLVDLRIKEGEHSVILGRNGCGKTTLIKALTRELYSYGGEGRVQIAGRDRWTIAELRTLIGVVAEEPRELLGSPTGFDLTVSGLLGTYGVTAQYRVTREMELAAHEALAKVEASHLERRRVETMSTGERKRVWIARALVSQPKALVLDEPTNGLDMKSAHEFHGIVERLARSGVTTLLVTHHLEEIVPAIKRVILMRAGRIVADGPRERVLTLEALSEVLEIEEGPLRVLLTERLRFLS